MRRLLPKIAITLCVFACLSVLQAQAQNAGQNFTQTNNAQAPINGGMKEVIAAPANQTPPNLLDEPPSEDAAAESTSEVAPDGTTVIKTSQPPISPEAAQAATLAPIVENAPTPKADALTPMAPPPLAKNDPDLFFDAESLVPSSESAQAAPHNVNPTLQPASRFVIVTKNAKPDSQDAKIVAASRAFKLGRYDAALEMYDALYEKNKRDPRILMGRAVTQQHLGQYDTAMQSYQELIDINPDNLEAKINMLGLLGSRYPAVALRELLDLQKNKPDNVGIVAQIAVTEAQLGNLDDALKYLAMAASMEPQNANHLFNMAVIADRAGKMSDAVKYYEKALEVDSIYGRSQSIPRDAVYERLAQIR